MILPSQENATDDVIVYIRRGHVTAESGPLVASAQTVEEALDRLSEAHKLYSLLVVRPDSPAALRLASKINDLYAA